MYHSITATWNAHFRCEKLSSDLQATQRNLAAELEEKQADCLETRATLEGLYAQLVYAEEKKKEVGDLCRVMHV